MVRKSLVFRLGTVALAAIVAACTSQTLPVAEGMAPGAPQQTQRTFHVAQILSIDPGMLETLPPAIPLEEGQVQLEPVGLHQISASFEADIFTGQTGTLRGFPPGFTVEVLSRSRFLHVGNVLVPYTQVEDSYVPLAFADQDAGVYFYPALVEVAGLLMPVYYVARSLLGPYTIVLPVSAPTRYISPITIILVPAPIVVRPIIIRPQPRPRPRPSPRPTMPPSPQPTPPPRPTPSPAPTARPTPAPPIRPTPAPTVRPTRPPRPPRDERPTRPPRPPRPREFPDIPEQPELPAAPEAPGIPGVPPQPEPAAPQPPTLPERPEAASAGATDTGSDS